MKVKTSVSLSDDILRRIDERVGEPRRRSDFIEKAVREHLRRLEREEADEREIELLNKIARGEEGLEQPDASEFAEPWWKFGDDADDLLNDASR